MKNCNAPENRTTRGMLPIACATALAVAFAVSLAQPARAEELPPPPVPVNLQVPPGNTVYFVGHAVGTQNYVCLPSATGFNFTLFTPQATLFEDADEQIITHFFSPNPFENGTPRVTWQDSEDTSKVWGMTIASVVVDHYGWVGFEPRHVSTGRLVGMALVGAGVALVRFF